MRTADQADDVFLSPRQRGQNREDAMREYLTWEVNLVDEMAKDDDHRFRVVAGRGAARRCSSSIRCAAMARRMGKAAPAFV